jgi:hypothetical protein
MLKDIHWTQVPEGTTIGKWRQDSWIEAGTLLKVVITELKWHERGRQVKSHEVIWLVGDMNGYGDSQGTYNKDEVVLLAWSTSLCDYVGLLKQRGVS